MSLVEPAEGVCHYYLIKKKRYCRFQPKEGQRYCPEHSCMMGIHGKRKRIPCPLNPSHNCYEDDLDKHVKKCNVTKIQRATQQASFYVRGINRGPLVKQSAESPQDSKKVSVKDLTSAELAAMIVRVNKLYEDHVEQVETAVFEHSCVREEYCRFEEGLSQALGEQAALRKELLQQASLVGQLEDLGLLNGGHCFVEMGAGKGKLSHWIQKASKGCTDNSFVLIERSSVRYKMDSFHKQAGSESEFKRIKIDIEDLCLGCVAEVNSSNSVVMVGKHLCGGATDMGIRCAVETLGITKLSHLPSSRPGGVDKPLSVCDSSEHKNSDTQLQSSGISLLDKSSSPQLDISENSPGIVQASAVTDSVPEAKVTFPVNSEVALNDSSVQSSSPNIRNIQHSPEGMPDIRVPQHEFPENESRTTSKVDNSVTLCQNTSGLGDQDRLALDQGRTVDTNKDIPKDTKRKESQCEDLECGQEPPPKAQKMAEGEQIQKLPRGIMIALCCHHCCTWDSYLGQEFMHSCGVTPLEFDLLTRLSSWATCAKVTARSTKNRIDHEKISEQRKSARIENKETVLEGPDGVGIVPVDVKTEKHGTKDLISSEASKSLREQLSVQEREDIGYKCKRLIDTGRLHYLRSKGMKCFLRKYISEELTPENIVLVAYLSSS